MKLQGENRPLSADNSYQLSCVVIGSRPAPTITWWKGSTPMKNTHEIVSGSVLFYFVFILFSQFIIFVFVFLLLVMYFSHLMQANPDGNMTTSILTFTPTIDDRGKYLSCRAEQTMIPESGMEDGWKLDIYRK